MNEPVTEWAQRVSALVTPDDTTALSLTPGMAYRTGRLAFDSRDWAMAKALLSFAIERPTVDVNLGDCVKLIGRCAIYLGELSSAVAVLLAYTERSSSDADGFFYLGRAYHLSRRFDEALRSFSVATSLDRKRIKYIVSLGQSAHALAFGGFGHAEEQHGQAYGAIALNAYREALAAEPANIEARGSLALFLLDSGAVNDALVEINAAGQGDAGSGRQLERCALDFGLALARGGFDERIHEVAHLAEFAAGRRVLARAKHILRSGLEGRQPGSEAAVPRRIAYEADAQGRGILASLRTGLFGTGPDSSTGFDLAVFGPSTECDVAVVVRRDHWRAVAAAVARLADLPAYFAGFVQLDDNCKPVVLIARKAFWSEWVRRHPPATPWADLADGFLVRYRVFVGSSSSAASALPTEGLRAPRRILVISRHGPRRLGGGEHFLLDAARTYAERCGSEVLFAGLSSDPTELANGWTQAGERLQSGFIVNQPDVLRALCLDREIDAVHCISGLGEWVAEACAGLNVDLVYGIHFWREFVASSVPSQTYFPFVASAPRPLPSFRDILARSAYCYVNSDLCADLGLDLYGWSPPVIYSVPTEEWERQPSQKVASLPDDIVLLPNSRADKGWDIFLQIAARLPHRQFLAIASQTDIEHARSAVYSRGLRNVSVLGKFETLATLYRKAKVVVVPSYRFSETFCRVAIEPGRVGTPVLMADTANLAYLAAGTDLALPPDPAVWAERIERVFTDVAYAAELARQSIELARSYRSDAVGEGAVAIHRALAGPRVLVCAGAGIGNICHVTPMIARLARALGCPVDVLLASDAPGTAALLGGAPQVSSAHEDFEDVRYRPYDLVLVTHCFGSVVPAFNARRVIASRDLMKFDPRGDVHESAFNLHFLKEAVGLDFTEADAANYFLGDWSYTRPASGDRMRIAVHAGSKGGHWAAKQWPHFERLVADLQAMDIDVISVGLPHEYVPGAIDRTGRSLRSVADELQTCRAMVANDSGLMNVANALGIPLVALFGPTNPVTRGPRKSPSIVIQPDIGCAPCEESEAHGERFKRGECACIGLIQSERVVDEVVQLIAVQRPHSTG